MPIDIEELKIAMKEDEGVKSLISSTISSAIDEATSGLKSTNAELKSEKIALQAKLEKMPTKEDLEGFKKIQEQLESSEDAKLIADGKLDEVIDRRTERVRLESEKKINDMTEELNKTKDNLALVNSNYDNHRINEAIRQEAIKSGVAPEAIEDVVLRSKGLFSIANDGKIVAVDSEGNMQTNDAGTVLDPKVFVADLKEKAPHFWPGSRSGNLGGSGGGSDDSLIAAAEKGNTAGFIETRRAQIKKRREATLK